MKLATFFAASMAFFALNPEVLAVEVLHTKTVVRGNTGQSSAQTVDIQEALKAGAKFNPAVQGKQSFCKSQQKDDTRYEECYIYQVPAVAVKSQNEQTSASHSVSGETSKSTQ